MKQTDPFYNSSRWKSLRAKVLRRDGYQCQVSKRYGKMVEATTVHHIFPREQYPEYQWGPWNLISLSAAVHDELHNRYTGTLSRRGKVLLQEKAHEKGIKISFLTLVVGLPGSGKTTYVKQRLGGGLAYDLDYLAAAFRLCSPHSEWNAAARKMASGLLTGFVKNALDFSDRVFVIRAAPTLQELEDIRPDSLVVCRGMYPVERRKDYRRFDEAELNERIGAAVAWAEVNEVEVVNVGASPLIAKFD